MKNYKSLEQEIEEVYQIDNTISILSWDIAVNMPKGSADSRADEISLLSKISHSRLKSDKVSELIELANMDVDQLDNWQNANLREIKKKVEYANCISDDLQNRYILASTRSELIWREAKEENNFSKLKPYLQEVLNCVREIAEARSTLLNSTKYDALIDEYDPFRKTEEIKQIFGILGKSLPNLIEQIVDRQKSDSILPIKEVTIKQQKLIGKKIMETMGFDFRCGRVDESAHPFCGGTPFDIRLTNRYNKNNFISGIMGIIHETGHALYEQNLPMKYKNQPVGRALGMTVHESQSLFMEMQVGRSEEFCEFLSKLLQDNFGLKGEEYSVSNLYKIYTRVKPDFIRVDADEVTYPMHIILRFEIEELLINKELELDDLPDIWNHKMQKYLGISPYTHREGCLQDIHWPSGSFGYFPAYTLGAMVASQLMKKLTELKYIQKYTESRVQDKIDLYQSLLMNMIGDMKYFDYNK
ncbi:MAG: carboxypeptidase M32, partial [Rickettsiales bacterium]